MSSGMTRQAPTGEAPDAALFETCARDTIARLPDQFRAYLADVVLSVEAYAEDDTLRALGLEHPLDLTGLYHGRPVGEKSSMESGALPDRIHLYRQAILAEWCETGVRLDDLIRHVTIHEIGHHFGLPDADMHALEDAVTD